MAQRKPKPKPTDVAILQGPTEDGKGARVVRLKDGVLSAGEVRPAREGEPLHDRELVRLAPLHDSLPICEVEVVHDGKREAPPAEPSRSRPARVATARYRKNWSAVFGSDRKRPRDYSVN